jgi:hypothetical protein
MSNPLNLRQNTAKSGMFSGPCDLGDVDSFHCSSASSSGVYKTKGGQLSNNDWYTSKRPKGKYYPTLGSMFEKFMGRSLLEYILFVPGGRMIVPEDNILRWPLRLYQHLYEFVMNQLMVESYQVYKILLGTQA